LSLTRRDIDAFAQTVLGRRLSPAELDDLVRQSRLVNLRAGDDVYLLDLVRHRDLLTRTEAIARKAAEAQSVASALRRLRGWIVTMAAVAALLGFALHREGQIRGYEQRDRMVAQEHAWTTTASGQAARTLHETGMAKRLIDCDLPGWVQIANRCQPGTDPLSRQTFGVTNRRDDASR
jgi:hypothetical protein